MSASLEPVLLMKAMTKRFPGVTALYGVDFELRRGEVHALVGENGAGKSTLLKILEGTFAADEGQILINGTEHLFRNIPESRRAGVVVIPQEIELAPNLSILENITMGVFPARFGFVDWKEVRKKVRDVMAFLGENLNENTRVGQLGMGEKQIVEILKCLMVQARIFALDEPTSSLSDEEAVKLFTLLDKLKEQDVSIIYVSHRLKEVFAIADRITVLRDGSLVGTVNRGEVTEKEVVRMMVGRTVDYFSEGVGRRPPEEVIFEIQDFTQPGVFDQVSFSARKGEILGIWGLVGSGRTEVVKSIFGAYPRERGTVLFDGREVAIPSPQAAVSLGIGLVPEDRHQEGVILRAPVRNNITVPIIRTLSRFGFIKADQEKELSRRFIAELNVKTPSPLTLVQSLSGGNQQKVAIAKWLAARSRVLILDEPTRGIDVGAKSEVYKLIRSLANEGLCLIIVSSELPEILNLSDRVLVMHEGSVQGEFDNRERTIDEETLLGCALCT